MNQQADQKIETQPAGDQVHHLPKGCSIGSIKTFDTDEAGKESNLLDESPVIIVSPTSSVYGLNLCFLPDQDLELLQQLRKPERVIVERTGKDFFRETHTTP